MPPWPIPFRVSNSERCWAAFQHTSGRIISDLSLTQSPLTHVFFKSLEPPRDFLASLPNSNTPSPPQCLLILLCKSSLTLYPTLPHHPTKTFLPLHSAGGIHNIINVVATHPCHPCHSFIDLTASPMIAVAVTVADMTFFTAETSVSSVWPSWVRT
jgi:hypothetical protein